MIQNNSISMDDWLLRSEFQLPNGNTSQLIIREIKKFNKDYAKDTTFFEYISHIVYLFANNPWVKQREVKSILNIDISKLKILNDIIRSSKYLQNLITKSG